MPDGPRSLRPAPRSDQLAVPSRSVSRGLDRIKGIGRKPDAPTFRVCDCNWLAEKDLVATPGMTAGDVLDLLAAEWAIDVSDDWPLFLRPAMEIVRIPRADLIVEHIFDDPEPNPFLEDGQEPLPTTFVLGQDFPKHPVHCIVDPGEWVWEDPDTNEAAYTLPCFGGDIPVLPIEIREATYGSGWLRFWIPPKVNGMRRELWAPDYAVTCCQADDPDS